MSSQDIDAQMAELQALEGFEPEVEATEEIPSTQDQDTPLEGTQQKQQEEEVEEEEAAVEAVEEDTNTVQTSPALLASPQEEQEEDAETEVEEEPIPKAQASKPKALLVKPSSTAPVVAAKKPSFNVKKTSTAATKEPDAPPAPAPAPAPDGSKPPAKAQLPGLKKKVLARPVPQQPTSEAAPTTAAIKPKTLIVKKTTTTKPAAPTAAPAPAKKPTSTKTTTANADNNAAAPSSLPAGPKKPLSGYMLFAAAKREEVKAENPDLKPPQIVRQRLGELWKEASDEEKATYNEQAAAAKERYEEEKAAYEAQHGPLEKKEKKPRAKSGYNLFCEDQREQMKTANPKAGMGEISKLLSVAWNELGDEGKKVWTDQALEVKASIATAAKAKATVKPPPKPKQPTTTTTATAVKKISSATINDEEEEEDNDEDVEMITDQDQEAADTGTDTGTGTTSKQTLKKRARARASGRNKGDGTAGGGTSSSKRRRGGSGDVEASQEESLPMADDDSDEDDKEEYSWVDYPATAILSKNLVNGVYVVAREGLPLHKYGEFPIHEANLHRAGQGGDDECPISGELIQEYEDWSKQFNLNVHDSRFVDPKTKSKVINLGHLPDGSLLEACKLLGDLREEGYELERSRKNKLLIKDDDFMSVPMLGTCRVVQRLIDVQRAATAAAVAEAEDYKNKWLVAERKLKKCGRASDEGLAALTGLEG